MNIYLKFYVQVHSEQLWNRFGRNFRPGFIPPFIWRGIKRFRYEDLGSNIEEDMRLFDQPAYVRKHVGPKQKLGEGNL